MSGREYMSWIRLAIAALALGAAPQAQAWGELGHKVIGDLAMQRLHEGARAEVQQLLAGEREPTLGGVASWADALRYSDGRRFRATSRWHYINARGGGCNFQLARDCVNGNCIVGAIEAQRAVLADRTQPAAARRDALKFLVHFVGDVHQPLHAGPREDSGGNGFQVNLARSAGRNGVPAQPQGTNLHTVWDASVLSVAGLNRRQYVAELAPRAGHLPVLQADAALSWARESCALVDTAQLYPASRSIDEGYLAEHRPLAEQQLVTAAVRLAAMLNETLGSARGGPQR